MSQEQIFAKPADGIFNATPEEAKAAWENWAENFETLTPTLQTSIKATMIAIKAFLGIQINPMESIPPDALATTRMSVDSVHQLIAYMAVVEVSNLLEKESSGRQDFDFAFALLHSTTIACNAFVAEARYCLRTLVPSDLWKTVQVRVLMSSDLIKSKDDHVRILDLVQRRHAAAQEATA